MRSIEELYPPFGLRVSAGDLTLRLFRDSDLPDYTDLISSRLFDDDEAPFVFDWWRKDPDERQRNSLQFLWSARAAIKPDAWSLNFAVFEGDRLVGAQDVHAKDFARLGVVGSGSYLRLDAQGRGIGTLMRQLVLVLAFDHLGAIRAESGAIVGNERSMGVSRRCGYVPNGTEVVANGDLRVVIQRVVVTPETLVRPAVDVEVTGLTPELRAQLGAQPNPADFRQVRQC